MKLIKTPSILFFIFLFFASCLNNVSFDDTDLNAKPVINMPLVYFAVNQEDFFDNAQNIEINSISDTSDFTLFDDNRVRTNLERVDLNLEVDNEFNRDFDLLVEFLDDSNNVVFQFNTFTIRAGENDKQFAQRVDVAGNTSILLAKQVRITVNLRTSSTVLDPTVPRELDFKSFGVFYLSL